MRTWLHTLGVMLAGTLIASCGLRTAISPEADQFDVNGLDAGMQPCGFGPPCNANDLAGRTCESLGLGAGDLSCDRNSCFLILKGCGAAPGVTPGQTGTGTPGGGQPAMAGGAGGAGAPGPAFFGGGTGAFPFFGGGTGGTGAFPFFGGGTGGTVDEDGGVANPGFFGGGFFGGNGFGGGNNNGAGNGSGGGGN